MNYRRLPLPHQSRYPISSPSHSLASHACIQQADSPSERNPSRRPGWLSAHGGTFTYKQRLCCTLFSLPVIIPFPLPFFCMWAGVCDSLLQSVGERSGVPGWSKRLDEACISREKRRSRYNINECLKASRSFVAVCDGTWCRVSSAYIQYREHPVHKSSIFL
jgi:hypothetical protein